MIGIVFITQSPMNSPPLLKGTSGKPIYLVNKHNLDIYARNISYKFRDNGTNCDFYSGHTYMYYTTYKYILQRITKTVL